MPACSNCKNLKYSSLYFEKVQWPWSKEPKGVSIRQIMSKQEAKDSSTCPEQ